MDPISLSLLMSAGTSLIKGGVGAAQYLKGNKLGKGAIRPKYNIPSADNEYLANARANSVRGLPGQDLIEQKLGASTASGIRQAEQGANSSAGLMATIAGLKGSEQAGLTDIGIKSAEYQDTNQQRLQEALLKYGNMQNNEFDMNQQKPFEDKMAAAQGLKGAGLQNIMTGIEGIAGAAGIGAKSKADVDQMTGLPFPKKSDNTPFGASTSTQRLGMNNGMNTLGTASNTQQYLNDTRSGKFKGNYNDWLTSKSMNGLNFNNNIF